MLRLIRNLLLLVLYAALLPCLSAQAAAPPRIFFTDLTSGPSTGGQDNLGAFVTLYGVGFGGTRGSSSVTVGGRPVARYPLWSGTRITVQLGPQARTGPIVAHIAARPDSNGIPFVIRKGRIYFVGPRGSDLHTGAFAHPWRSLPYAIRALRPGDIVYAMDGLDRHTLDRYDSALSIQTGGKAGAPLALLAYPGATVVIGGYDAPLIAARTPNIDRTSDHWVLAGLTFHGAQEALDLTASTDWRIVGNDFSCPNGFGPTGCVETSQATYVAFLGNTVHDVARPGATKAYHGVYFSTDSNHIDVGWNTIERVRGCRGLQFHSSPLDPGTGHNQYDLRVHDNVIHDVVCDGINFATVDPSKGPVEAWNNLIYNAGAGPDPGDGGADYACIYVQGGAEAGPPGQGLVDLSNNTLYNCGARNNTDSGALALSPGSPRQQVLLRNNLIVLSPSEPLLTPNSTRAPLLSQTNLVWRGGAPVQPPPGVSLLAPRDPMLRNPVHGDFTLKPGSPAIRAGTQNGLTLDLRGTPRPPHAPPDLGALQHNDSIR